MNVILVATEDLSKVTKTVVESFNTLSEQEFMHTFSCSKDVYLKRVIRYGDPYMNAPLAKIGKKLNALLCKK